MFTGLAGLNFDASCCSLTCMHQKFSDVVTSDGVRSRNSNFILGLICGIIAAIIGAAIWFAIVVGTGAHVGIVAIGIGALIGVTVRLAGNGRSFIYGVVGAVLTALSCIAGESLTTIQLGTAPDHDFYSVMTSVDPVEMLTSMATQTSATTWVIYGIGILEAYLFSIRHRD